MNPHLAELNTVARHSSQVLHTPKRRVVGFISSTLYNCRSAQRVLSERLVICGTRHIFEGMLLHRIQYRKGTLFLSLCGFSTLPFLLSMEKKAVQCGIRLAPSGTKMELFVFFFHSLDACFCFFVFCFLFWEHFARTTTARPTRSVHFRNCGLSATFTPRRKTETDRQTL